MRNTEILDNQTIFRQTFKKENRFISTMGVSVLEIFGRIFCLFGYRGSNYLGKWLICLSM